MLCRWVQAFCLFLLIVAGAVAQTDQGRIAGSVKDSQGAVIPGALIMVNNVGTGETRTVRSGNTGAFMVAGLAPGRYSVTAKTEGFAATQFENIQLAVGQERTLEIVLQPAAVETSVTVDGGEMVLIDTSSARIGTNVGEHEVNAIPLNGRQLSQLYLLTPGAVTAGGGSFDNIRFSGRANQENAIRFDGVEGTSIIDASPGNLNGEISSGFRLQSSLENVQEFRVESNNYPAEYGTGTGGQISVITKSGTNTLHGGLFEYVRNSALDARNFFDRTQPQLPDGKSPLRLNQFGGSVGGPLKKDKAFFFGSYEGLRQRVSVPFVESVPSAAARARAVPSIAPVLAAFPLGIDPTANPDLDNAVLSGRSKINENAFGARFDYRINDKYSAYLRYFRDQGTSFQPTGVTGNGFQATAVPQNGVVEVQQVISPSVLNQSKFGFNAVKTRTNGFVPDYPGLDLHTSAIVIGGGLSLPGILGQGTATGIATPTGLVRANSSTNGRGQPYTNYTLSFIDNLTWVKETHSMKFGVEVRPVRLQTDRLGGATYSYSTLNDFLNNNTSRVVFLSDVSQPSPYNGGATGLRHGAQTYYIGYAQDEWKLRPNLTMNYGLRYEYYSVMRETHNLDVVFNMLTGNFSPPDTPFYKSSTKNFGPRLAFSWAPARLKNKTVLRAGSGLYYGPGQTEDQIQPIESDRISATFPAGTPYPINPLSIIQSYDYRNPPVPIGTGLRAYAPGYTLPERILSYTASLQQELPGGMVLTVAYVGSQGRNLFLRGWTNQIIGVTTNPSTGTGNVIREFGASRFDEIDYKTSGGRDSYNAMQMTLNRRMANGLTAGMQWTWSHSIGNTAGSNDARTAQNPNDFAAERSNNTNDVRHSMNLNVMYELPFGTGKAFHSPNAVLNSLLGGWEVGGVLNARSGLPIEVGITRNDIVYLNPVTGAVTNNPVLVGGVPVTVAVVNTPFGGSTRSIRRPDLVPGVDPYLHTSDKRFYLNPAAFAMPAPGTYGNLARNALVGPGLSQLDLTLHKRFLVSESKNVEFRTEIYNLLNRANFSNPPATLANALGTGTNQIQPGQAFTPAAAGGSFGVLSSTVSNTVGLGAQRQIQFSLRLNF